MKPSLVVVVGAGLSGATAAWSLATQHSSRVLVLEARDRVGGRLYSSGGAGAVLDLGAAWTWPSHDVALGQVCKAVGVATRPQFDDGSPVAELAPGQPRRFPPSRTFSEERRLAGGAAALPARLLEAAASAAGDSFELRTSCAVSRIALVDGGAAVEVTYRRVGEGGVGAEARVLAGCVVVAAPPRLVAARVTFSPELPAPTARAMAQSPTWMADTAKVAFVADAPFWRAAGYSGSASSYAGPLRQVWDNSQDLGGEGARPALVGFAMGDDAAELARGGDAARAVLRRARAQIDAMFPGADEHVTDETFLAWGAEEWTRHEGAGMREPAPSFGHPALRSPDLLGGRLVLAGTETEDEHGHMEGAVRSGLRAAEHAGRQLAPTGA